MKIQRALILPVLVLTLIASRSDLRAQAPIIPSGGQQQLVPVAIPQTPLGVPTRLGLPEQSGPASFAGPGMGLGGMPPMGMPAPGMMGGMGPGMGGMGPGMGGMGPGMGGMMGPGRGMGPGMGGMPPNGMPPNGMPPNGVAPASFGAPLGGQGEPAGACPYCGGAGCGACSVGGWALLDRVIGAVLPYQGGGYCEPRWFDLSIEALYLKREEASRRINITSDGVAGLAPPNIVLSTDDIDFHDRLGFRFTGAMQFGASANLEVVYFGTVHHNATAQVTSGIDNLFSALSQFGNNPPPSIGPPITIGGFTDSDGAESSRIDYSSNFDSIELDFRRRWMAPNCRLQGSWLMGFRYFLLEEKFGNFITVNYVDPNNAAATITGFTNYFVETVNSMTGYQIGGDLWMTVIPGVRVGADVRSGIYYNRAQQATDIFAASLTNPIRETVEKDTVAFLAEANLMGVYRFNENFSIRAGIQALFADGVALAAENFNAKPPFLDGARTPIINDNGNVFYYGYTGGLEWMW